MNTSDLRKTFNEILSNYDTCTEQMKLVIISIALSLNKITQTDGQTCGIFCHENKNDVNKDNASKQILSIIKKHNNSFLPMKGAFNRHSKNPIERNQLVTESTGTQLRKQKRMRITSNKEKDLKQNGNRNIQYILNPKIGISDDNLLPCFIDKNNISSCDFCGSNETGENISNCSKRIKYRREFCEYIVSKSDEGNKRLINCL